MTSWNHCKPLFQLMPRYLQNVPRVRVRVRVRVRARFRARGRVRVRVSHAPRAQAARRRGVLARDTRAR